MRGKTSRMSTKVSSAAYLAANTDVAAAIPGQFASAYQHYVLFGQFEGRPGAQLTDGTALNGPFQAGSTGGGNVGQTFTLTEAIDNLVGTAADDAFIAGVTGGGAGGATLTPGDVVKGGAGADSIELFSNGNIGNFPSASVSDVETVFGRFSASGATLDVSGNADVTAAWFKNANVADAAAGAATVKLTTAQTGGIMGTSTANTINGKNDFTFDFGSPAAANDSANIALSNAKLASTGTGTQTVTVAGIETLNVAATGANSIGRIVDTSLQTLNVTGKGSVTTAITDGGSTLTKIDASANTGGVNLDLTNGAGAATAGAGKDLTITGSSANDEIGLRTSELTKADAINLGDGAKDTLTFSGGNATFTNATQAEVLSKVSGVEVLKTIGSNLTVDGDFVSQNMFATKGTSNIVATNLDDNATVTFLDGAHGGSSAGLKLGSSTLNVELTGTKTATSTTTLTATGTNKINVLNTDLPETGGANTLNLTAADNQNVTLTGSGDLTATFNAASGTTGFNINGSAVAGKLDLTGTGAADIIVGGASNDTLRGEATTAVGADDDVFNVTFGQTYDEGDKLTIKYSGVDYSYTVTDKDGTTGEEFSFATDIYGADAFTEFKNAGGQTLTARLATDGVTTALNNAVPAAPVVTFDGPDGAFSFTVEASVDNSADEFDNAATQTIDPLGAITRAAGDQYLLNVGGVTWVAEADVTPDTIGGYTWTANGAASTQVAFETAVNGKVTLPAGDTLVITANDASATTYSPVASSTYNDGGATTATVQSTAAPTGAPANQGQPTVVQTSNNQAGGTVINGAKSDTFTGNGGADKFFIATASASASADADVITDFLSGTDTLNFDFNAVSRTVDAVAGTSTNYAEGATPVADFANALVAATGQVNGTVLYSAQQVGADTFVFYDGNGDGDLADAGTDYVVKLAGVGLDGIAFADIA